MLVDTHCHIQHAAFDEDRDDVVARALEMLDWVMVIGDDLAQSERAIAMAGPGVYTAIGLHPYHAADCTGAAMEMLRTLTAHPSVKALGEMGLDYHNVVAPKDVQATAFTQQLELAGDLGLPVIIHNRDSHDDVLAILREYAPTLAGGIMHCFSGDAQFAERTLELGFHVSFAGNVTFPKAQELRDAAAVVPLDRLLVETDSPYLAPQARRGKRCEPSYVVHTAAVLAGIKGVDETTFAEATTRNAERLFGINGRGARPAP